MMGSFEHRSTLQKFVMGVLPATKRSVWLLAIAFHLGGMTTVQAQLRSGRTERALYVDELSPGGSRVVAAGQAASVVRSTGQRRQPSTQSIVQSDAQAVQTAGHSREATVARTTGSDRHQPPLFATSYADGFVGEASGCVSGDCYEPGCTSCDSYSVIAPTCSSLACLPCGTPLLDLWCRTQVRVEVPLFWRRAQAPPALVTTDANGSTSAANTLLGNGILNDTANAGFRLTLATPLGAEGCYGLMFRYWNAGDQDDTYAFDSSRFPVLARPFLNTSAASGAVADTLLVASPNESTGNISVATSSQVDGLELSLKRLLYRDRFTRVDMLYGYQHVSIDEGLVISSHTLSTVPPLTGNTIAVTDRFETGNDFHGVAYGVMGSREIACWRMETMFRLGLGNLRRKVDIRGATTTTSADGATQSSGEGLLARNTNDQGFVDDTFVVIPEVGINFAYRIRPGLDFNVGYNYMLVPKVAQASQQINDDLAANLSDPLVGALDPALNFDERKYWINSLGLGLQLRY